ncbi:pyridoxal phosphate-dependent aminotransferase [Shouchella clausii]|uniref:pyridoxal phosphate-dependent aminotransferase n=1 Tax=Shouchella clausii TaxID=79880 RepID=UPI0007948C53|nr:pyridoxal phosphate-dependent aminotransferase [Shouchella clausii]KKI85125.1 hypothetical protein WZ76_16855 [Shouchella clausii]
MSIDVSKRISQIPFSDVREIFEEAKKMERAGHAITHMEIGRPDFDTPAHIKKAAALALENGDVHYTSNVGTVQLREAIAKKLSHENEIHVNPDTEVVVTIGCKEAIVNSVLAYVNPGDEVLIPDPGWLEYRYIVELASAKAVPYPILEENQFIPDPKKMETLISNKTKMIILNTPHNPTGAVVPREILMEVAQLAERHNLIVLSDEIYEKLVYDGAKHVSFASLPGMKTRTLTINGFSKAYAMDGWRLGYAAGEEQLLMPVKKVHQYHTTCATSFAQAGGAAAYNESQRDVESMVASFNERRQYLVESLSSIEGIECTVPKGAFYLFPKFPGLSLPSKEIAKLLLLEAKIACVPGSSFGEYGEGYVRMAYSTNQKELEAAVTRLRAFMETHASQPL